MYIRYTGIYLWNLSFDKYILKASDHKMLRGNIKENSYLV